MRAAVQKAVRETKALFDPMVRIQKRGNGSMPDKNKLSQAERAQQQSGLTKDRRSKEEKL